MSRCILIISSFLLAASALQAQSITAAGPGEINVYKDNRLDMVIQKQIYINAIAARHVPGYRIQVIYTNNRTKAVDTKSRLMQLFPDYPVYISYEAPYFRVRIGDFRTPEDAEGLQQQVGKYFPDGVFVARDIINVTPDNNNDTNDNDSGN